MCAIFFVHVEDSKQKPQIQYNHFQSPVQFPPTITTILKQKSTKIIDALTSTDYKPNMIDKVFRRKDC